MSEKNQIQIQVQALLNSAYATDMQMYNQYVGKQVVIEEGDVGDNISIATLNSNGAQNVELTDYSRYGPSLEDLKDRIKKPSAYIVPILEPKFTLPRKILNKSQIASIQSLDDILGETPFDKVFPTNKQSDSGDL